MCRKKEWKIPEMVTREGSNELIFGWGASSPVSIIIKMCFTLMIIIIYELSEKKFKKVERKPSFGLIEHVLRKLWLNLMEVFFTEKKLTSVFEWNEMKSWGHCVIHIILTRLSFQISISFLHSPAHTKAFYQQFIILVN